VFREKLDARMLTEGQVSNLFLQVQLKFEVQFLVMLSISKTGAYETASITKHAYIHSEVTKFI
jgi:hypothetical protein